MHNLSYVLYLYFDTLMHIDFPISFGYHIQYPSILFTRLFGKVDCPFFISA